MAGSIAYKESVAVGIPLADDNAYEEPPYTASASASASEHLLRHNIEFEEARTEKPPIWKRLKNNMLVRARRRYRLHSRDGSCAQCRKENSGRQTPLRKCTSIGFWIFAIL